MKKFDKSHHSRNREWRKILFVMKFKLLLLLCCAGQLSAGTLYSQQPTYNVRYSEQTIISVLGDLQARTGYTFVHRMGVIPETAVVSASLSSASLEEILKEVLINNGFEYSIEGKIVLIFDNSFSFENNDNVVIVKPAPGTKEVTGRIVGVDGKPIVGASVFVKGNSKIGTISDSQGMFRLILPQLDNPVISVTFVGMKTVEFTPTAERHNITLEEADIQLAPVTVTVSTGYQEIPRERMTGAYATVTSKELENSNFMSVDQALQGRIAGLYSTTTSGEPGVKSEIRIRGDNSISGNNEPLWIVDGLPLQQGVATISGLESGDLQGSILNHGVGNIAPEDIESVTILKDAAATAIYGASAAAGVIVVKTKKGGSGPISINYKGTFSLGEAPTRKLDFMNAAEKVQYEIELAEQFGNPMILGRAAWVWNSWKLGDISNDEYNKTIAEMSSVKENWFDQIYRTSFSHKHNVSMRGGTDKLWFYGSFSATDEKAILRSNRYNAFSTSLSAGYRLHDDVTVNFKVEGHYRESNNHNSSIDPFKYAVFANPYEKAYNDDGSYAWDVSYGVANWSDLRPGMQFEKFNILNELENTRSKSMATDITATLSVNWRISDHLKADGYVRIGHSISQTERWADRGTYTSWTNFLLPTVFAVTGEAVRELPEAYNNGYIAGSNGRKPSYSMRIGFAYDNDINSKHFFNLYGGSELRSSESWRNSFRTVNYNSQYYFTGFPELGWNPPLDKNLWGKFNSLSNYVYGNKDRYVSFFGSLTYSYMDRYVVNANARFDGAGTIHADNRFTPLWSVSARWNLTKENFIRDNLSFLSTFAIRAVYGYTGQIDKSALPFSYVQLQSNTWDGDYQAKRIHFPNPGIKWEKKRDKSIGLDYAFFNNAFGGSVNYYHNKTIDLLDQTTVANSFGNTTPKMNKGSVTNQGFEFHFNLRLEIGEVRWLTSFNINTQFTEPLQRLHRN